MNRLFRALFNVATFCAICLAFVNTTEAQGTTGTVKLTGVHVTYEGGPLGSGARIEGTDPNGNHWTIYITAEELKRNEVQKLLAGFPYYDGEGDHEGKKTTGEFSYKGKEGNSKDGFSAKLNLTNSGASSDDPLLE